EPQPPRARLWLCGLAGPAVRTGPGRTAASRRSARAPRLPYLWDAGAPLLRHDPHPARRCRVRVGEPGARHARRPGACAGTLERAAEQAAGGGPGARHLDPRARGAVAIATLLVASGWHGGP